MVIDSILNTIAAMVLHLDHVYTISITRHISSPSPQALTFQVKVPQNIILLLLILHFLWLLAVADLEGSMNCTLLYLIDYTVPGKLSSALFPLQLIPSYLSVSKNTGKGQLQIWFEDYWHNRESLLVLDPSEFQ